MGRHVGRCSGGSRSSALDTLDRSLAAPRRPDLRLRRLGRLPCAGAPDSASGAAFLARLVTKRTVLSRPSRALQPPQRQRGSQTRPQVMPMLSMSRRHPADDEVAAPANGSLTHVSRAVHRLDKPGWVTRRPDREDGRFTLAVLADVDWDKVVARAPGHVAETRRVVSDPLTKTQLRQPCAMVSRRAARAGSLSSACSGGTRTSCRSGRRRTRASRFGPRNNTASATSRSRPRGRPVTGARSRAPAPTA